MKKIIIALGLSISLLALSGCNKSKGVKSAVATNTTPSTPNKRAPFSRLPSPDATTHNDADGKFAPIFFLYDESTLSDAGMLELDEIALFLEEHPNATLRIAGHADERGTEDYNMSLGQERAESIKRYLTYLRIDPARIITVSYGEELPLAEGLDEESLAMNRRGEFEVGGLSAPVASNDTPATPRGSLSPRFSKLGKRE